MDRLLAKLERRIGRFAIPNLAYIVFGGMGLVFLLSFVRPEFENFLTLDWSQVMRGQVWRLITFIFIPTGGGGLLGTSWIWTIIAIYMFFWVTQNLESHWGTFKLNVFYFMGMLGTIAAGLVTRAPLDGTWLNSTLWLAFATVFPDMEILLMFFIPVKVKWLGLLAGILQIAAFVMGGLGTKLAIGLAFANYMLFFTGHWVDWYKQRNVRVRQAARRAEQSSVVTKTGGRTCAICGKSEDDGADIRVCSCEKCQAMAGGKSRTLCLEHARNH